MEIKEDILNESIANWCTVNGAALTISGNRCFYASEIAEHFGVEENYISEHRDAILECINREIVSEADIFVEDGALVVDLTFYGDYCAVDFDD